MKNFKFYLYNKIENNIFVANSMAIVGKGDSGNSFLIYCDIKLDFPTPISPTSITIIIIV